MYVAVFLASVLAQSQSFVVEGKDVGRAFAAEGGRIHTESVHNGIANGAVRVRGPEFVITDGEGATATSDDFDVAGTQRNAGR